MSKNNYINKIKNPKFIVALSLILLTVIGLSADYLKTHNSYFSNYFNKKQIAQDIEHREDDAPETLSVVVAASENSNANEIDVSISEDVDEKEPEPESQTESIVQPNIVKNNSQNNDFTKIVTVHTLISKFLQNIEYSSELTQIERLDLPKNIIVILEEMRDYNIQYLTNNPSPKTEVVFPNEGVVTKIIGRFIKIEKSPVNLVAQTNMHNSIVKNIHIIEEYFYSRNKNPLDKEENND